MVGGGDRLPLSARAVAAGDGGAAVVAADGTVDWWCPGRLDRDPLLWRLVDPGGAALRVGPSGPAAGGRLSYVGHSMVTSTVLDAGARGALEVVDVASPHRLVRIATAVRGAVEVEVALAAGRAWRRARRVDCFHGGVAWPGWVVRAPGVGFTRTGEGDAAGAVVLAAGERLVVTVAPLGDPPLDGSAALDLRDRAVAAGRRLAGRMLYEGPGAALVRRSVVVLHALADRESGGVAASATTSLPGWPGGDRQRDSRHTWVRHQADAALVWRELGYADEAAAALGWLGRLVEGGFPLDPVRALDGEPAPVEQEAPGSPPGWMRSQPVVVGAAAERRQIDLDVLGAVAPLVDLLGGEWWPGLRRLADGAAERWEQPDTGPWGPRARQRRRPLSAVRAWALLDRMVRAARARSPLDLDAVAWHAAANDARRWAEDRLASEPPDAALLRLAWQGPWPAGHEPVRGTVDRVLARLSEGPFLHRLEPGAEEDFDVPDAASVEASFWAVRALAALERWEEAHERFDALCGWATAGTGLLPRGAHPGRLQHLGDLPDAGAHLALVAAARALAAGPR